MKASDSARVRNTDVAKRRLSQSFLLFPAVPEWRSFPALLWKSGGSELTSRSCPRFDQTFQEIRHGFLSPSTAFASFSIVLLHYNVDFILQLVSVDWKKIYKNWILITYERSSSMSGISHFLGALFYHLPSCIFSCSRKGTQDIIKQPFPH